MSMNRRLTHRNKTALKFSPVSCALVIYENSIPLEIVNYHFKGACFRVKTNDYRFQEPDVFLKFQIGFKNVEEKIHFRVVWETVAENGMFGVEFSPECEYVLKRAGRFISNAINSPIISSSDPLDPNRIIYFKVLNASRTGMLLCTSLSNKHLFPGMEMKGAVLDIPGMGKSDVDLFVENSRPSDDRQTVLYGVSIKGTAHNFHVLMTKYLSNLGQAEEGQDRIELLAKENSLHKNLRRHLTIREISSEREYEAVLKLRLLGYSRAGKIRDGLSWKDMGEGLDTEGLILGAYLGGQLIASCEFRLAKTHGLRLAEKFNLKNFNISMQNLAEINKLVVHPNAQRSDVVLGIFQRIHAIGMLNGQPDGLVVAEDKLIPLYMRLGFQSLGVSYQHPVKEDTKLTLMLIRGNTYATSEGMNPYAWAVAFEETQKFFDEIGFHKTKRSSFSRKIIKEFTPVMLRMRRQSTRTKKLDVSEKSPEMVNARNTSNPRWTQPHLNATILLPYVLESVEIIGKEETAKILSEFGFDFEYFKSISNWVSIDFFDEYINKFSSLGDPYALNRRAGYRSLSKEVLGANYFVVKHFFSPAVAFKSFEKFLPKFNKTRIYKVIDLGSDYARIKITNPDPSLLPKHESTKENWYALVDAYVVFLTGAPAKIDKIKSSFNGDPYCEFVVHWQNPTWSVGKTLLLSIFIGVSYGALAYSAKELGWPETVRLLSVGLSLLGVAWISFRTQSFRKKYLDMIEALADLEKHADARYQELQASKEILEKSYQEGKILEKLNREVQTLDDLSRILDISLASLCNQFRFGRAFVMLLDQDLKYLRTSAVYGASDRVDELWKFKVDVSVRRKSSLVLSSVFHSGQSILVTDVDDHKFHMNEASRQLIEKLGTKGFAIVPIPSESKNWGVLVADKGENESGIITRRDLVALQRICQLIGIALDKRAKIETEIRIRNIFQKFVPASVIENTLSASGPKLGGETRDIICLFLDIRNFTQISSQIPAVITCDILNSIFDLLNRTVRESNGTIDKFLGDGALLTWGALPGSDVNPGAVLSFSKVFLERLNVLNDTFSNLGLPPIQVGMGIHRGPVIAGNIGSADRMEFTVIGNTVNVASRLEQLTKVLDAQIVVSEQFYSFDQLNSEWKVHEDINVRGVDQPIKVASLKMAKPLFKKKSESA